MDGWHCHVSGWLELPGVANHSAPDPCSKYGVLLGLFGALCCLSTCD